MTSSSSPSLTRLLQNRGGAPGRNRHLTENLEIESNDLIFRDRAKFYSTDFQNFKKFISFSKFCLTLSPYLKNSALSLNFENFEKELNFFNFEKE